jgi:hypothetical protein
MSISIQVLVVTPRKPSPFQCNVEVFDLLLMSAGQNDLETGPGWRRYVAPGQKAGRFSDSVSIDLR